MPPFCSQPLLKASAADSTGLAVILWWRWKSSTAKLSETVKPRNPSSSRSSFFIRVELPEQGFSVQAVICAHHALHVRLADALRERIQISFPEFLLADVHIDLMAQAFRPGMDHEVLYVRSRLEVLVVVPLNALDKGHTATRGEVRIFPIGFLAGVPSADRETGLHWARIP